MGKNLRLLLRMEHDNVRAKYFCDMAVEEDEENSSHRHH
jgi:hypothetical protein